MDMKKIDKLPFALKCITKEGNPASLTIARDGNKTIYTFDVITKTLYRMGDDRDNKVELLLNGKWELFTPALNTTCEKADLKLEMLENNNKRSHYRLIISIEEDVPDEISARIEGVEIS